MIHFVSYLSKKISGNIYSRFFPKYLEIFFAVLMLGFLSLLSIFLIVTVATPKSLANSSCVIPFDLRSSFNFLIIKLLTSLIRCVSQELYYMILFVSSSLFRNFLYQRYFLYLLYDNIQLREVTFL